MSRLASAGRLTVVPGWPDPLQEGDGTVLDSSCWLTNGDIRQ